MNSKASRPRVDIYARITDRIVADLEQGVRPWVQPWSTRNTAGRITRPLRHNGTPYQGINIILLWSEALARGFASNIWMTFKQAVELGGHVRKGESGSTVVYASQFTGTETDEHGDEVERGIPFLKAYSVFNVDQIDGLPDQYYGAPAPAIDPVARIAHADTFFDGTGAKIAYGGTNNGIVAKHIRFLGKAAHAGGAPHAGINALNAAMIAMSAIHAQRETYRDEDTIRIHPIITQGGIAVSSVPADVHMETFVRGKTIEAFLTANQQVDRALQQGEGWAHHEHLGRGAGPGCSTHDVSGEGWRRAPPAVRQAGRISLGG